jgi:hypothetical protein
MFVPNGVNGCKYMIIQNVSQILIILIKPKSGNNLLFFTKLLPVCVKNFPHAFLMISMRTIVFKREQDETRLQEGRVKRRLVE